MLIDCSLLNIVFIDLLYFVSYRLYFIPCNYNIVLGNNLSIIDLLYVFKNIFIILCYIDYSKNLFNCDAIK